MIYSKGYKEALCSTRRQKYSRQVHQSPNLGRHVYIAAHTRLEDRFTIWQEAIQ